jgi:hypothetical protein
MLLILCVYVGVMTIMIRSSRRARRALFELAGTLGWTDVRKPLLGIAAVRGMWNGKAVAFSWRGKRKNTPPYLSAEIDLPRPGRFEIRSRTARENFLERRIMIFGPPKVELFEPADEARYRAWASDRSLVDSVLATPGIRERLDANLAEGGALSLKNGRLKIRRPLRTPPARGLRLVFRTGPDLDRIRTIALEEWGLITGL